LVRCRGELGTVRNGISKSPTVVAHHDPVLLATSSPMRPRIFMTRADPEL